MIEPHLHWTFLAFNTADVHADNAQVIDWAIEVSVTGHYTEEEATLAAQAMIQRDQYRLRRVDECTTCGYQEAAAASMATLADNSK